MKKRGRPATSPVRQNLVEMLYFLGSATGYDLAKLYVRIFPGTSQRNIYYQLQKGAELSLFTIETVKVESGSYSWGSTSEKIYYSLGKAAKPKVLADLKKKIDSLLPSR